MLLTRRLLATIGMVPTLLLGLSSTALCQLWLSQVHADSSYLTGVLAGLVLTAFGMGLVFPTAAVAVTAGMPAAGQGLAGGLLTSAQQVGAAIGLAVLATLAAARSHSAAGSLVAGYRLSYLLCAALIIVALATVLAHALRARLRVAHPPAVGSPTSSATITPGEDR